jgi:hypothetical protein
MERGCGSTSRSVQEFTNGQFHVSRLRRVFDTVALRGGATMRAMADR